MISLKRWDVALIAAMISASTFNLEAADSKSAAKQPNIVFILADDLGYGDLGFQGGKDIPTPNIDQLAKEGVRLTSGYVSGPYCSPTRAGLLTGKYQQRFGHEFNPGPNPEKNFGLSLDEKTIADRLKSAGYATALVGKWHLGNGPEFHPQKRGFDTFFGFLGGAHPYFTNIPNAAPIFRGTEVVEEKDYLTDAFTREAVSYLDGQKGEQPFFLYLAYNAVHGPLQATPEDLEKLSSIQDEKRRNYAGLLTALDRGVGKVVGKLKEKGLDENTLVVFFSDNGGPQSNGSTNGELRGQKATTWEGGIRVPFVFRWTGHLPAGAVYSQPVIQLDLLPTALALANTPVAESDKLDGVNVFPYLTGEKTGLPHEKLYWRFGEQNAIVNGNWKLVKGAGSKDQILINLAEDIGEQTDLSAQEPERLKALQTAWAEWDKTLIEPKWKPAGAGAGNRQNGKKKQPTDAADADNATPAKGKGQKKKKQAAEAN